MLPHLNRNFVIYHLICWSNASKFDNITYIMYEANFGEVHWEKKTCYGVYLYLVDLY